MTRGDDVEALRWFALSVRSRQEKAAQGDLEKRGVEVFLPTRVDRRVWSDRVQNLEIALFPGYLFVRTEMSAQRRVDLLKARGVFDLVGRLPGDVRIAQEVPDWQVESLRTLVAAERVVDPVESWVKGTRVRVAAGALKGALGVVEEGVDGKRRLVVQVDLLGRGVRCVLMADDLLEDVGEQA